MHRATVARTVPLSAGLSTLLRSLGAFLLSADTVHKTPTPTRAGRALDVLLALWAQLWTFVVAEWREHKDEELGRFYALSFPFFLTFMFVMFREYAWFRMRHGF